MKTEIKQYTVYDWEALPDEGKAKALEKYRYFTAEDWDPSEYYDSSFFCDVLSLPLFLTMEKFSYSLSYSQGDGASPQLSINNIEEMIRHFAKVDPSVIKALRFINSIETYKGSPSRGYSHYTSYSAPYIEIASNNILPHCQRIKDTINGLLEEEQKDINRELYKHLLNEYDYQLSDENIIEYFKDNDYMFTENGCID